ncbi:MAG: GntR family transcriptional regulator [Alphaproteobacteria bacterium]|nr:GntR family transcriptional regulator [Alphaproteobacteria bacterium]
MTEAAARLRPVKDGTLRAQIAEQLNAMVTSGRYAPGERLTEQALAAELGVSRAPLREAIRDLVDRGVLISQPYRGLFVRPVGVTDIRELYSMRIAFEQFAFKLAWEKRSPEALDDLRQRYRALIAVQTKGDQATTIAHETRFHSWVYELAGHALLMSHWERLIPLVQIYMSLHHKRHGSHGQFRHMTTRYLEIASGDRLDDMLDHIEDHMKQGLDAVIDTITKT